MVLARRDRELFDPGVAEEVERLLGDPSPDSLTPARVW